MKDQQSKPRSPFLSQFQSEYFEEDNPKRKKREILPAELLAQQPLNPHDRHQQFYRQSKRVKQKRENDLKMGWRISFLSKQQEDLSLICFNLFQAEVQYPIKIFTIDHFAQKKYSSNLLEQNSKALWMQTQIFLSGLTQDEEQQQMELSIYKLCVDELLPMFRQFLNIYITWSYIISPDFKSSEVVDLFEENVIKRAKKILQNFKFKK